MELLQESKCLQHKEKLVPGPSTGVQHLDRLGLLPSYGMGKQKDPLLSQLPGQGMGVRPKDVQPEDDWDHLSQEDDVGKNSQASMHLMAMGTQGDMVEGMGKVEKKGKGEGEILQVCQIP